MIRFQELLQRTAGESLENWNVPYFRVGGAGMHYPRVGKDGNISYPPNIHSPARAFGPMLFTTPETPREEQTTDRLLQAIGFGGTWFDSHDVESYLQEKGIRLSAQSSFVDIDASLLSPPSLTVDSNSQEPSAPPSRESPSPWVNQLEGVPHLMQASFNDDGLLPQGPILDNGIGQHEKVGDLSHWSEGRSSAAIDNWRQQVKQISGQLITIDVDRFLERKFFECPSVMPISCVQAADMVIGCRCHIQERVFGSGPRLPPERCRRSAALCRAGGLLKPHGNVALRKRRNSVHSGSLAAPLVLVLLLGAMVT